MSVTVNGALRTYGCDPIRGENIPAINTAINRVPHLVANPAALTPKSDSEVTTTYAESVAIYLAGLAQGAAFYQAYDLHKTTTLALDSVEEVLG